MENENEKKLLAKIEEFKKEVADLKAEKNQAVDKAKISGQSEGKVEGRIKALEDKFDARIDTLMGKIGDLISVIEKASESPAVPVPPKKPEGDGEGEDNSGGTII